MSWFADARRAWRDEPFALVFFSLACAIGVALRMSFPGLIEYNGDEE